MVVNHKDTRSKSVASNDVKNVSYVQVIWNTSIFFPLRSVPDLLMATHP